MKSFRRILSFVSPYRKEAILSMALLLGVVAADLAIPRLTQQVFMYAMEKSSVMC